MVIANSAYAGDMLIDLKSTEQTPFEIMYKYIYQPNFGNLAGYPELTTSSVIQIPVPPKPQVPQSVTLTTKPSNSSSSSNTVPTAEAANVTTTSGKLSRAQAVNILNKFYGPDYTNLLLKLTPQN